jgi:hypothetical protein
MYTNGKAGLLPEKNMSESVRAAMHPKKRNTVMTAGRTRELTIPKPAQSVHIL